MDNQRALFRIPLKVPGELQHAGQTSSCELVNLTEQGVQLTTHLQVSPGEQLRLTLDLASHATIHCTILVTNVTPPHIGGRIIEIDPSDQAQLSHFIEQLNALNLTGF